MTRISPVRRGALLLATLAMGLGGAAATAAPGTAVAPPHQEAQAAAPQMTKLTFAVHGCDGCTIQPLQYIAGQQKAWEGKRKTVKDGSVSWTFRTKHTHGMSVWITGPWEGQDGSTADEVTIPLEVRDVMVKGVTHKTAGTLAWTKVTQDWWRPMLPTDKGILGSQDILPCEQP